MEATPWISAAVGLFGVITGALGTVFVLGRKYGHLLGKLDAVVTRQTELTEELEALKDDYQEFKMTASEAIRESAQEITAALSEVKTTLAVCSNKIDNLVTQKQHQDLDGRISRVEGSLVTQQQHQELDGRISRVEGKLNGQSHQ